MASATRAGGSMPIYRAPSTEPLMASTAEGHAPEEDDQKADAPPRPRLQKGRDMASFLAPKPKQPANAPAKKSFIINFEQFPLWMREGPWQWNAVFFIPLATAAVIALAPRALATMPAAHPHATLSEMQAYAAAALFVYCVGILVLMFRTAGASPMVSFTMLSWLMSTLRFGFLAMDRFAPAVRVVSEFLRGPALSNSIFLGLVWWLALVPVIAYFSKSPQARRGFFKFNFSFFLLNVHLLNMALGMAQHRLDPRPLRLFDLWTTLAFSMMYVIFYLGYLDRTGVHLYIILSPRTKFAFVVYSSLIALQLGLHKLFGGSLD